MEYDKAVEFETLKENSQKVLQSINGLMPEDAMNALATVVAQVVIKNWPEPKQVSILNSWFSMVRGSLIDSAK